MLEFNIVGGTVARELIEAARPDIVEVVRTAYLTHDAGDTINPNSYFLRFPQKPNSRIIALPAYLGGEQGVAGIKWIGSFPDNVSANLPRASAVLLLNDYQTGYPFACLEASQISAARTAASAVLAAEQLRTGTEQAKIAPAKIAVIGSGIIARNIVEFLTARQWQVGEYSIFDKVLEYAQLLSEHISRTSGAAAAPAVSLESAIKEADVVVLATTAGEPYLTDPGTFAAGQVVLNISLRDIDPAIILQSQNVLDDIEHCLTANTSPHLAEQQAGNRDFIDGTLAQLLTGAITLTEDRPKIFSPFGLGVLDLAVGMYVYDRARAAGRAVPIEGFFGETERWTS